MKFWSLTLLLIAFGITDNYAQKINLETWTSHIVDSLQKNHIDTIVYYHAYCGECFIARKPTDTVQPRSCDVGTAWVQIANDIFYKQKGKYFSLTFNCSYPPIKKELKNVKSLDYFLSIVPVLVRRDRYSKEMFKKRKFNPPIVVDGGHEEALLYCGHIKKSVFMQEDQKTDKGWRQYFWIDKQTKLLALLESDISPKN